MSRWIETTSIVFIGMTKEVVRLRIVLSVDRRFQTTLRKRNITVQRSNVYDCKTRTKMILHERDYRAHSGTFCQLILRLCREDESTCKSVAHDTDLIRGDQLEDPIYKEVAAEDPSNSRALQDPENPSTTFWAVSGGYPWKPLFVFSFLWFFRFFWFFHFFSFFVFFFNSLIFFWGWGFYCFFLFLFEDFVDFFFFDFVFEFFFLIFFYYVFDVFFLFLFYFFTKKKLFVSPHSDRSKETWSF